MAYYLKVVFLLVCVQQIGSVLQEGPLPENMERCLRMRCSGVSPKETPAFNILYTCINFHLAYKNIDKEMIRGLTPDNINWLHSMGRQLTGLILEAKKKKRKKRQVEDTLFRTRRDIRTFSKKERDDYFRVINELKAEGLYDTIANLHQHTAIPAGHFGPAFTGWHRVFLIVFQLAVWSKNRDMTIPFCDTRLDYNIPEPNDPWDTVLFSRNYFGTGSGVVVDGPFKYWATPANTTLQRNLGNGGSFFTDGGFGNIVNATRTREILVSATQSNIELHHNDVHVCVGGQMGDLVYSPSDPFFFCHHAYVDYVWQKFRDHQYENRINPAFDYPYVNDSYHHYYHKMEMLADYLAMEGLVQINGYDNYFNDPSVVRWDDSHYTYPDCAQYPDIKADNVTGKCYSAVRSKSEDTYVKLLQSMRSAKTKKFVGTRLFTAFKHDARLKTRTKRAAMFKKMGVKEPGGHLNPMNLVTENTFQLDGVIDSSRWAFVPIRIVYERAPDTHFNQDTAKYQRVLDEVAENEPTEELSSDDNDLYAPSHYRRLAKKLKHGRPATYGKSEYMDSGAYRIFVEAVGFSYIGKYIDYAIVDERQPVSEVVAYAAVKRPVGDEVVETFVTAYDPNGRVCEARCLVCGSDPPRYEKCSGVLRIDNSYPKMYGNNLGDAYLLRYKFQRDGLPLSRDNKIFLMFFCEYESKFPWKECRG